MNQEKFMKMLNLKRNSILKEKPRFMDLKNDCRIETCNDALQDINWTKILKKQQSFLDRYTAYCRTAKDRFVVEYFLEVYEMFKMIVYDPLDQNYKKLEEDINQISQFAVLTSEEEEALKETLRKHIGCEMSSPDFKAEEAIAIREIRDWDILDSPLVQEYIEAEGEIIKTISNPAHQNESGLVKTRKVIDIMYGIYEYSVTKICAMIEQLKTEGDVIEPKEGYLKLDIL